MSELLPLSEDGFFDEVTHQGKTIKVGDEVVVNHAGRQQVVTVSSISRKQDHYWVGYLDDQHFCPWPLVQLKK
jgi:hypothetical protein